METRTLKELERRLALSLARSFEQIETLKWNPPAHGNRSSIARLNLNIEKPNAFLYVIDYKGSALVKLDGEPYWSLDGYHKSMRIPTGRREITAEFTPFHAFGEKVSVSFGIPMLTIRNEDAYRFWNYCFMILSLAKQTKDKELSDDLFNLLDLAFREGYFESVTYDQLLLASVSAKNFPNELLEVVPKSTAKGVQEIGYHYERGDPRKWSRGLYVVENGLNNLVRKYGKRGEIVAIAHGHIDAAWLWHFRETEKKVTRTFSIVSTLFQKYEFSYMQSMALYYEWTKKNQPALFEKIRGYVEKGIWELGAGWVENDTNLISGESFARQFLYSQRFYKKEFGKIARVYWLPDTFGFAGSIPQIARLSGIEIFATQKVYWNDTNTFPYSFFSWIGIDGTALPAMAFGHAKDGYNSEFSLDELTDQWSNWTEKDIPMLYSFGYGDGGGGPTEEMLIRAEAVNKLPTLPQVTLQAEGVKTKQLSYFEKEYSHLLRSDFFKDRNKWRGELYAEFHRGVLTSHTKIKALNRRAETALREAELWSTILNQPMNKNPHTSYKIELEELWKIVLKHQFHDVLPGSAINVVYSTAYEELESVIEKADTITKNCTNGIARKNSFIFNSLAWTRQDYIVTKRKASTTNESQFVDGGYLARVSAPSVGFVTMGDAITETPRAEKVHVEERANQIQIENNCLRIVIDKQDGEVRSIFDKDAKREVLKEESNVFVFYENLPGWADAWDIEKEYKVTSFNVPKSTGKPVIVENGPLRVKVKLGNKSFRNSKIHQEIVVHAGSRRIDFKTGFEMRDRELLLKVWFHMDVNSEKATYEIPFGNIERKVTTNTSYEKAMFEVPMQKWVDFSDSGYGVAILNDGRYGIAAEHGSFGISVVRTPIYPDFATDSERGSFTFSIYPHSGTWQEAEIPRRAIELNSPIQVTDGRSRNGVDNSETISPSSFVNINSPNIMLETIKEAEDGNGMIFRLYETENKSGEAKMNLWREVKNAKFLDILELNEVRNEKLAFIENEIVFSYKNYQIMTLKVELQE
jgi:alpha-mannosidase